MSMLQFKTSTSPSKRATAEAAIQRILQSAQQTRRIREAIGTRQQNATVRAVLREIGLEREVFAFWKVTPGMGANEPPVRNARNVLNVMSIVIAALLKDERLARKVIDEKGVENGSRQLSMICRGEDPFVVGGR
jgi:hypothetical protein